MIVGGDTCFQASVAQGSVHRQRPSLAFQVCACGNHFAAVNLAVTTAEMPA